MDNWRHVSHLHCFEPERASLTFGYLLPRRAQSGNPEALDSALIKLNETDMVSLSH